MADDRCPYRARAEQFFPPVVASNFLAELARRMKEREKGNYQRPQIHEYRQQNLFSREEIAACRPFEC